MNPNFYNFDVGASVASYRYCLKQRLDFSPLTLMLFRYRRLTRAEIAWLNCARWVKVAGRGLSESDQRKLEQLHNRIIGKPDGDWSASAEAREATGASRDNPDNGGSDDSGPSIGGLVRGVPSEDEDEEKAKPSLLPLVQEPVLVPPVPTAETEKKTTKSAGRLTRWLPRKGSGPEID